MVLERGFSLKKKKLNAITAEVRIPKTSSFQEESCGFQSQIWFCILDTVVDSLNLSHKKFSGNTAYLFSD